MSAKEKIDAENYENICLSCKNDEINKHRVLVNSGRSQYNFLEIFREKFGIFLERLCEIYPRCFLCRRCVQEIKRLVSAENTINAVNKYFNELFKERELESVSKIESKRLCHNTSFEIPASKKVKTNLEYNGQGGNSDSSRQYGASLFSIQPQIAYPNHMFIPQPYAGLSVGNVALQSQRLTLAMSRNNFDIQNEGIDFVNASATSTPKKRQVPTNTEPTVVTVSVKYPSKSKQKKLEGDFAKLGKALVHENNVGIANTVTKSIHLREKVIERILRLLKNEIEDLCSTGKPSLLRGTTKEKLSNFKLEKLCEEWAERAPLFYSFLRVCCFKSNKEDANWCPGMAMAGSVLLKQRNKHMNVMAAIIGITLKTSSTSV